MNMKVWIVVATCVWWTAVVGLASECPAMIEEQHALSTGQYKMVNFSTKSATVHSYLQFIGDLREQLGRGSSRHEIPLLRDLSTVPHSERLLLVKISNCKELCVTLAVDVTNAHVVAYEAKCWSYFFPDAHDNPEFSNVLFKDKNPQNLLYNSNYWALQNAAQKCRQNIQLGLQALEDAISNLGEFNNVSERTRACSLLVLIQMVSEAARFRDIEQQVCQSIKSKKNFRPDIAILGLEDNWEALSKAIQQSNEAGVFSSSVQLKRPDNSWYVVDNVRRIIANIALMVPSQFSLLITPVVTDGEKTCVDPEPTVRISGRNGLCVDVRDGQYYDGNSVQLWRCKEQLDVNQLWTLKRDGTIRSNGKCLTSSWNTPERYVKIYDCDAVVPGVTRWQVLESGTIVNPHSELVLTAKSREIGTALTMETNINASRQCWLAGNNTEPFLTSIVGSTNLYCMEPKGDNTVWLMECESSKAEQKWAIYPDGSIRPRKNRDHCLTYNNNCQEGTITIQSCSSGSKGISPDASIRPQENRNHCPTNNNNCQEGTITISSCSSGSEGQRWVFKNDGTILNLASGKVMDVKESNPSLNQIIAYRSTGNPNQKWLPLL